MRLLVLALVAPLLALIGGASALAQAPTQPAAAPPAPTGQAIAGQVFGPGGRPLDGVVVQAFRAEESDDLAAQPVATDLTYEADGLAHGAYRLEVEPGEYVVRFSSAPDGSVLVATTDYRRGATLTVAAGEDLALDDVVLSRPATGEVTGTVVDELGEPWAGIEVVVVRRTPRGWDLVTLGVTDRDGRYALRGLLPGADYTVGANGRRSPDGEDLGRSVVYLGGAPVPSLADTVRLAPGESTVEAGPLELTPGVEVTGRVADLRAAYSDIQVGIFAVDEADPDGLGSVVASAYVQPDGSWALPVPGGYDYTVAAMAIDGSGTRDQLMLFLGDTLDPARARIFTATPGLDVGTITLDGAREVTRLRVRVAPADGDLLDSEEIRVNVLRERGGAFRHIAVAAQREDGSFVARVAPGATYSIVTFDVRGRAVYLGDTTVEKDATRVVVDADDTVVDLGTITRSLDNAPAFAGRVTVDGEMPAVPVRVTLYQRDPWSSDVDDIRSTWTRADGSYVLRVPHQYQDDLSSFTIHAAVPGHDPGSDGWLGDDVDAAHLALPTGRVDVDPIAFAAAPAMLGGTVVGTDGEPLAGSMTVRLHRREGSQWEEDEVVHTRGPGWGFAGLAPGEYAVTVEARSADAILIGGRGADHRLLLGGASATPTVQVGTGDVLGVEIGLTPGASVSGVLRNADGTPAEYHPVPVEIGVRGASYDVLDSTWVDGRGRYSFEGLPPGRYDLQVFESGSFGASRSGLEVAPGDDLAVDLQISSGRRLEGVVVDEEGEPLAGIPVGVYFHSCIDDLSGPMCHPLLTSITDAQGRYSFADTPDTAGKWVRVAAEWKDFGYDLQFSDQLIEQGEGVVEIEDLVLTPGADLLRTVVRSADGRPLGGTLRVQLISVQGTDDVEMDTWEIQDPGAVEHVVVPPLPFGYFRLRVTHLGSPASASYVPVTTAMFMHGPGPAHSLPDIVLAPPAGLTGTVRVGGQPVSGVMVRFAYEGPDGTEVPWALTDTDGRYELRVPAGTTGTLSVSSNAPGLRAASLPGVSGGVEPGQVAEQDVTLETDWDAAGYPGERLDHCLATEYVGHDGISFDGLDLSLGAGYLAPAGWSPYDGDPFDPRSTVPFLAPAPGAFGETRWGVSPDGEQLCVQVGTESGFWNQYQVLLTSRPGGGHDVVYSYGDELASLDGSPAGYSDGLGSFGDTVRLPGFEDVDFVFRGFDLDAAPVSLGRGVAVVGERRVGATLSARPGAWAVDGERRDDVEHAFRWWRDGEIVGAGATYDVQPADYGTTLVLEVDTFVPGHALGRAEHEVRIRRGIPVAEVLRRPSLSSSTPAVGENLLVRMGAWRRTDWLRPRHVDRSVHWFVDGARVSSGRVLPLLPEYVGSEVWAEVVLNPNGTVHGHGYELVSASTKRVTVAAGPPVQLLQEPTVVGDPAVGSVLTVSEGQYDASDTTVSYAWYSGWRLREPVAGSGSRSYAVTAADLGRPLTVVATASAPGRRDSVSTVQVGPVVAAGTSFAPLEVSVTDAVSGLPLEGAAVRACAVASTACTHLPGTDVLGLASRELPVRQELRLVVERDGYRDATTVVSVVELGLAQAVALEPSPSLPANVWLRSATVAPDGTSSLAQGQSHHLVVDGCPTSDAQYVIELADGSTVSGSMATGDVGSPRTYEAWTPELMVPGWARVTTNLAADCDEGTPLTTFEVYIDPSGVVTDQYGEPIAGATVVLQRAETPAGPYVRVPNGSSLMSKDNQRNPDTTDASGFFRWDVQPGWYRVRATAPGCAATTTDGMVVPPERVDLLIALDCAGSRPWLPRDNPTITGSPAVGSTLTAEGTRWPARLEVSRRWLRDGRAIPGATGATYVVAAADAGHELTVRETGRRPAYVQEAGRGAPVEFAGGSVTSDPVSVPTPPSGGGGGGDGGELPSLTAHRPVLAGSGRVGTTLTAPDPVWSAEGVTTTLQWLVDGDAVDHEGATYELTPTDIGKEVTVRYTGRKGGYADGLVTTEPVEVVAGAAPTADAPLLRGSGRVGTTLTVADPAWSRDDVATTRQWTVDGEPVAGATGPTFAVGPRHRGSEIGVRFTGTSAGFAPGTVETEPVTGRLGARATLLRKPVLRGVARLGKSLRATPGRWDAAGLTFTYQWLRDGKVLRGATDRVREVRPADRGHRLRVIVTASRAGHAKATGWSKPVWVRR